jgi:SagB-type dehydrogenase family enzyme
LSAGVTKRLLYPGGEIAFRAAACAGALYPIEVYVVCGDLPGLPAGVYHFSPADFSLGRLRDGDFREFLARASGGHPDVASAPLTLVFTAITWRSSWKYQARSYRYHFWDSGTILANSLAACAAQRLPASAVMGFVDADIDRLVGVDGEWEKSLALLPVGRAARRPAPAPDAPPLSPEVEPLSADWRVYPLIDELHQASRLEDPQVVERWRERGQQAAAGPHRTERPPAGREDGFPLWTQEAQLPGKSLAETIVKRGSSRRFRQAAISFDELSAVLAAATNGFMNDWSIPGGEFLNELYLNVHAVEGLPPGAYRYQPESLSLNLLKAGDFRAQSAHLCLGQDLGGTASFTAFFLADLEAVLERYGNRGYRLAQMEAGILGGRLYLGAYALGRGASGLTFFDDDVVDFFAPSSAGLEPVFVTAVGAPARPAQRSGRLVYTRPGE